MKITEAAIEKAILTYLNLQGQTFALKIPDQRAFRDGAYQMNPWMPAGIPDIVILRNGITTWVEIKTPTGTLSEGQKRLSKRFNDVGVSVLLWRGLEDAKGWLEGC